MTRVDIKNSNLIEIMDEKSKINLEENLPYPLYIKHVIDGEEVTCRLDIIKERLNGIYITVNQEKRSEDHHDDDKENYGWVGNIQIPQIEGINEAEHKKVQELCKIYGKFPSEDNLTQSIKSLQGKIKKTSDKINILNQEKINLEEVKNASKALNEIYIKYELSGFDEDILNENIDKIAKYEKTKEILKTTDIEDETELGEKIESSKNNIEKLEQIITKLNMESNQISDSYSSYQKYKDIGIRKLDQLKKEYICNFKAMDELKNIYLYDNDKTTHFFCKEKAKVIDLNIENIDKKINAIGVIDESENDDKIEYLREKLRNKERYIEKKHPLNDSDKEKKINEITKSAMEDINSSMYSYLNAISELYNIEIRITEIKKEIKLQKDLFELQREVKILEGTKGKLEILDKYRTIIATRDKHKDNELFKNSYEKKYEKEIKEYNQVKSDLASIKISNWDDYNEAKSVYDNKEKVLLKSKNISDVESLDAKKQFEKIFKYKNKRDEIISKNSNLLHIDIDENSHLDDKAEKIVFNEEILKKKENNINKKEETKKTLKIAENSNKTKQEKVIKDTMSNAANPEQAKDNYNVAGNSRSDILESKNKTPKKTLQQLKTELLCNLKAKNELNTIIEQNGNKEIKNFCEGKVAQIDITIKNLDNEISTFAVLDKSDIDDKIKYMVYMSKLYNDVDKKRNLGLYNSLKENEVMEITKNAMADMEHNIANSFMDINELYNIENKRAEVQRGIDINQQIIELEDEGKRLEVAKVKLDIVRKYNIFGVSILNNSFYKTTNNSVAKSQIEEYKLAQKYLDEMEISNKRDYKEAKDMWDTKKKRMFGHKNITKATSLDNNKELKKIENYKSKQNEIINKYRTT